MFSSALIALLGLPCTWATPKFLQYSIPSLSEKDGNAITFDPKSLVARTSKIYVSTYDGLVTTFTFSQSPRDLKLAKVSSTNDCGLSPTWLNFDRSARKLYCISESIGQPLAVVSTRYAVDQEGRLAKETAALPAQGDNGPVHTIFVPMGDGKGVHLVSFYGSGNLRSYDQDLKPLNSIQFPACAGGGQPRAHQVISDARMDGLVFIPDLGCNKIQVLKCTMGGCAFQTALDVKSGGPRHAVVWYDGKGSSADSPFLFVTNEYSNMVEGYRIAYEGESVKFDHVSTTNATQAPIKDGYSTAEISLSPDHRFLVVSNRGNNLEKVLQWDPETQRVIELESDTITSFRILPNGNLEPVQAWPSGGKIPRSFAFNYDGSIIAIGNSERLIIMERDVESGKLGQVLEDIPVAGPITGIAWDEEEQTRATKQLFIGERTVF